MSESSISLCKQCSHCKQIKNSSEFSRDKSQKDGLRNCCRICQHQIQKQWCINNPQKIKDYRQSNYERHIEKRKEQSKKWQQNNPEKIKQIQKRYQQNNPEKMRTKATKWRKNNPVKAKEVWKRSDIKRNYTLSGRLNNCMSSGIYSCLRKNKSGYHWEFLVGYTFDDLKEHLEVQFKNGMNWQNYGKFGWHLDHIRPISSFTFSSPDDEQFKQCWALSNLQPLWAFDNLSKHNKILSEKVAI